MGYLVVENCENTGSIKEIAISGHQKTISYNVEKKSNPIPLTAGTYTVTVTIDTPTGKIKKESEPFIIYEGKTTTVIFGNPPENGPVPLPKTL